MNINYKVKYNNKSLIGFMSDSGYYHLFWGSVSSSTFKYTFSRPDYPFYAMVFELRTNVQSFKV